MNQAELDAIEALARHPTGDAGRHAANVSLVVLVAEVRRLLAEREDLRAKAKVVREFWRENPGFSRDGISAPGMVLLMAVER
jgi:hypothetical protein